VSKVVGDLMRDLMTRGTTAHLVENMVSLQDCFESVGLSEMLALDESYSAPAVEARR
jgi:hypothetical protein